MEIYPIRSSQSFQFRNNHKSNSRPEDLVQAARTHRGSEDISENDTAAADFSAISISEVRDLAQQYFLRGEIDQDTFSTLYGGLPMQAIDAAGRILDLSDITETTPFDFRGYYHDQLTIASSLGDPENARVLQAVIAFMDTNPSLQA